MPSPGKLYTPPSTPRRAAIWRALSAVTAGGSRRRYRLTDCAASGKPDGKSKIVLGNRLGAPEGRTGCGTRNSASVGVGGSIAEIVTSWVTMGIVSVGV